MIEVNEKKLEKLIADYMAEAELICDTLKCQGIDIDGDGTECNRCPIAHGKKAGVKAIEAWLQNELEWKDLLAEDIGQGKREEKE